MNWPLNFNQPSSSSSWMMDDETQRHLNLAGSSSQQSLDSNHNTTGDGDGRSFLLLLIFSIFFAHLILLFLFITVIKIESIIMTLFFAISFQASINLKRLAQRLTGASRCRQIIRLLMVGQISNNNKHMEIRPDPMQLEIITIITPTAINGRKSIISMEQIHQQVFHLIYLKITTIIIGNRNI